MTFFFWPFNNIPVGGIISIYWATGTPAVDNNWVFTNNYCKILSGLDDPDCNVSKSDKRLDILGWRTDYNAVVNGQIKLELKL